MKTISFIFTLFLLSFLFSCDSEPVEPVKIQIDPDNIVEGTSGDFEATSE